MFTVQTYTSISVAADKTVADQTSRFNFTKVGSINEVTHKALCALTGVVTKIAININISAGKTTSSRRSVKFIHTSIACCPSSVVRSASRTVTNVGITRHTRRNIVRIITSNTNSAVDVVSIDLITVQTVSHHTPATHTLRNVRSKVVRVAHQTDRLSHSSLVAVIAVGNGAAASGASVVVHCIKTSCAVQAPGISSTVLSASHAVGNGRTTS